MKKTLCDMCGVEINKWQEQAAVDVRLSHDMVQRENFVDGGFEFELCRSCVVDLMRCNFPDVNLRKAEVEKDLF